MSVMRFARRALSLFEGHAPSRLYATIRIGVALLVLVRTSDWLRPLPLDHHSWVFGIDHWPSEGTLASPMLISLPYGLAATLALARIVLAATLLFGLWPRASAALLSFAGFVLMGGDRFQYFHHLHLLWSACALVSLTPCGAAFAIGPRGAPKQPVWALRLIQFQVLVVYGASGLAKLRGPWLDGRILERLSNEGLVESWAQHAMSALGPGVVASGVCVLELALVPLLIVPKARLFALSAALIMHAAFSAAMTVSTFGATMTVLLLAFVPLRPPTGPRPIPQRETPLRE